MSEYLKCMWIYSFMFKIQVEYTSSKAIRNFPFKPCVKPSFVLFHCCLSFSITINNTGFTWFTWTSLTLCDHVFLLTTFWRTYCNFSVHSSLPSVLFLDLSASLWEGREESVCWLVRGKPPALQGEDGRIPLCWWVELRFLLYCFMVMIDTYQFFHFVVLFCFVNLCK